jgi:hypothetical protein
MPQVGVQEHDKIAAQRAKSKLGKAFEGFIHSHQKPKRRVIVPKKNKKKS